MLRQTFDVFLIQDPKALILILALDILSKFLTTTLKRASTSRFLILHTRFGRKGLDIFCRSSIKQQ